MTAYCVDKRSICHPDEGDRGEQDMSQTLTGKRVLLTQADDYMGPATIALFEAAGAEVLADTSDLSEPSACEALVAASGQVDVLIANLASQNYAGINATDL